MDMVRVTHQRWGYHRTSVSNIRNDKTSRSHEDQQFYKVLAIGNMITTALKSTRQIGGSETIYHAHEGDWAMSGWLIPVIPALRRRFVGKRNLMIRYHSANPSYRIFSDIAFIMGAAAVQTDIVCEVCGLSFVCGDAKSRNVLLFGGRESQCDHSVFDSVSFRFLIIVVLIWSRSGDIQCQIKWYRWFVAMHVVQEGFVFRYSAILSPYVPVQRARASAIAVRCSRFWMLSNRVSAPKDVFYFYTTRFCDILCNPECIFCFVFFND